MLKTCSACRRPTIAFLFCRRCLFVTATLVLAGLSLVVVIWGPR